MAHLSSWVPYAAVAMISAFIDPNLISPMQATIPGLCAKLSFFWPSIIGIASNKDIQKVLFCNTNSFIQKSWNKSKFLRVHIVCLFISNGIHHWKDRGILRKITKSYDIMHLNFCEFFETFNQWVSKRILCYSSSFFYLSNASTP